MNPAWDSLSGFSPKPDFTLLDKFVEELEKWNRAVRLVGPFDREGIAVQVADSLLPFKFSRPEFPLLDIGSGAGLPAIPIAATWKSGKVLCIEPRSKRVSFIRHAARTLGLTGVKAVCARAEEALIQQPELAGAFASVTARAVADVQTLLSLASPYLAEGGRVLLGRGGEDAPPTPGWTLLERHEYIGPTEGGTRSLLVFSKS